jgi:thiamine biosynthesis protein ThiI
MNFVVKYFSEIAIKTKPVRRRFIGQLAENLRATLGDIDSAVKVHKEWDKLQVETGEEDPVLLARMVDAMCNAPGVTYVLEVSQYPLPCWPAAGLQASSSSTRK